MIVKGKRSIGHRIIGLQMPKQQSMKLATCSLSPCKNHREEITESIAPDMSDSKAMHRKATQIPSYMPVTAECRWEMRSPADSLGW